MCTCEKKTVRKSGQETVRKRYIKRDPERVTLRERERERKRERERERKRL